MTRPPRRRAVRSRHRARTLGRVAEGLCAWFLRLKGYRILARGYRTPVGEIDLVAARRGTLAIVEVKARQDVATAAEALGARQRAQIVRAAEAFMAAYPASAGMRVRFDVILVRPWGPPVHMQDAWRPNDRT